MPGLFAKSLLRKQKLLGVAPPDPGSRIPGVEKSSGQLRECSKLGVLLQCLDVSISHYLPQITPQEEKEGRNCVDKQKACQYLCSSRESLA